MKKIFKFLFTFLICITIFTITSCDIKINTGDDPKDEDKYYTVTFFIDIYDSTPYESLEVKEGNLIEAPADPTKENYDFAGWINESILFDFNQPITKNITLYADWVEKTPENTNTYTIKFYNSYSLFETVIVNENEKLEEIDGPTKKNYVFTGWYTQRNGSELFDFTTSITSSFNLYAGFRQSSEYTVNFYVDNEKYHTSTVKEDSSVTEPSTPSKKGYNFIGWYTDEQLNNEYNFNTIVSSNLNLYAKFEELPKYTINFLDGDNIYHTELVFEGYTVSLPTIPTKDNYSFAGWYTNDDFTTKYDFSSSVISDLDLYAKWVDYSDITINFTDYSGYNEGAYVEFEIIDSLNITDYSIYYKKSTDSTYKVVDSELIRLGQNSIRCDVLGLSAGTYSIRVEASNGNLALSNQIDNLVVTSFDRSGFAHFKSNQAIGAYNNDGTLKSNAVVVYVSEETKNTVTAKIDGKIYTGLVNIIQAQSNNDYPLVIRILGTIGAATWNEIEYNSSSISPSKVIGKNGKALSKQNLDEEDIIKAGYNTLNTSVYSKLNNLTNKIKYSGSEFDSYYNMLDVNNANNVTIEGVGTDARIFQWGFTWKNCNYIEVRNLTFEDYTEDACSFEGSETSSTTEAGFKTGNIWFHHNTVLEGINYWDVCNEQDKHDGDGSVDLKGNKNITISYNVFTETHKTGLVGGSDSSRTTNVTFHHNYYLNCGSRLPLGRQAVMHMYNNYYYGSTGTNMSIRAGGYAFIENSVFENCNNPVQVVEGDGKKAAVKSYNNEFTNCKNTNNATIVSSRTQTVASDNLYNKTFDTDSSYFYYDSTNQCTDVEIMTPLNEVKEFVKANAGVLKGEFTQVNTPSTDSPSNDNNSNDEEDNNTEIDKPTIEITSSTTITFNNFSAGEYTSNLSNETVTIIKNNSQKTLTIIDCEQTINTENISKYVEFGGAGSFDALCIKFSTSKKANITVYYAVASDNRYAALYNSDGQVGKSDVATTKDNSLKSYTFSNIEAGQYSVTSAGARLGIYAIVIEYLE